MAAVELDPIFVKALRLLHSKARDSTAQLKAMLDEAIRMKRGHAVSSPLRKADRGGTSSTGGHRQGGSIVETEKRKLDKLKRDLSELMPGGGGGGDVGAAAAAHLVHRKTAA